MEKVEKGIWDRSAEYVARNELKDSKNAHLVPLAEAEGLDELGHVTLLLEVGGGEDEVSVEDSGGEGDPHDDGDEASEDHHVSDCGLYSVCS